MKSTTKRKYVKLQNGAFIKAANSCGSIAEVAAKTGMSYAGVKVKIRALVERGCVIKNVLKADQRTLPRLPAKNKKKVQASAISV